MDSEHNALLQVILSSGWNIKSIIKNTMNQILITTITASGGPFIDLDISEFKNIKSKHAIKHPTWNMGEKYLLIHQP